MPSSPVIINISEIPGSLARRARRKPLALTRNGRAHLVIMSARVCQQLVEMAEAAEDRYWLDAISKMTPKDRETIGVKETRELLDYIAGEE